MKPHPLLYAIIICALFAFIGDDPIADRIQEALEAHYKKYPQEKIYLLTDKPAYSIGQTIWYKIYATVYGNPATLSKIVYVYLVESRGKIIIQNKLALTGGNAHGDMQLPEGLPSNTYQLRCFTQWMLNFDESLVFHKPIYIKNLSDTLNNQPPELPIAKTYQVQFFPEGGDLVDNITCNVAFKATDQNGLPVEVHGEIKDNNDALIDSFKTFHDGMGKFPLHPEMNRSYHAAVYFPDHSFENISLPDVKNFGISMKIIEQSDDAVIMEVARQEPEAGQFHDIVLAAYQQSGKVAAYPLQLARGKNIFNIRKKGFATGILRFTIFDSKGLPQAERIVFINNKDQLELQLQKDSVSFNPKGKSSFTLQVEGNICSAFLLSSELKGYVHDPGYYFGNVADSVKDALDLIMMTNGWRHFEWKQILNDERVKLNYPVEEYVYIAGKILDYKAGEQNGNFLKMIIRQSESIRFMGYVSPDSNGSFILKDYIVPGLSTVYFQQEKGNGKHKSYKVQFFSNPLDTLNKGIYMQMPTEAGIDKFNKLMYDNWNQEEEVYLSNKKGMLKPVIVKGHIPSKTELLLKDHISPYFEQGNAHDIDLVNNFYPNSLPLFDFLKGRFPGLSVQGTEDSPEFYLRGEVRQELIRPKSSEDGESSPITPRPYFYVNEVHSSYREIINIPLSDIALIRYISPPASMAPLNGGAIGVIAIYLKKPGEGIKTGSIVDEYNQYIFHGYSITRQFYSRDYSARDPAFSMPDNRETLYWNPDLTTDSSNRIHFSFYSSDHAN